MKRILEEDLAVHVVTWLEAQGWEVYQEVAMHQGGSRCDLVATQGPLTWAIESKVQMGLVVLEQAHGWLWRANFVSVAVGWHRDSFARRVARDYGIGVLMVTEEGWDARRVEEVLPPQLHRPRLQPLRAALREDHRTWARAGNARSEYYSPWRKTVRNVQEFVAQNGPTQLQDLIAGIEHHYTLAKTARACLVRNIEAGLIEGVVIRREGKRVLVLRS